MDNLENRLTILDLNQILPQENNANQHTDRGMTMLDNSISRDGWSGAGEMAANNQIYHGSARRETLSDSGKALVLDHDGSMPIYLRRTDIPTADDAKAVRLGVAHNRIAEVNLSWEPTILLEANNTGLLDIDDFWLPTEQAVLLDTDEELTNSDREPQQNPEPQQNLEPEQMPPLGDSDKVPLAIVLTQDEMFEWNQDKERLGYATDSKAFKEMWRQWKGNH